jgi:hypothetical protein
MRPRLGLSESGRSRALRVPRVASRTVRAMPFPLADFAYFLSIIRDRITPDVGGHSTRCPLKNLGFSASADIRRRPDYKLSGENRGSSPLGSASAFFVILIFLLFLPSLPNHAVWFGQYCSPCVLPA